MRNILAVLAFSTGLALCSAQAQTAPPDNSNPTAEGANTIAPGPNMMGMHHRHHYRHHGYRYSRHRHPLHKR